MPSDEVSECIDNVHAKIGAMTTARITHGDRLIDLANAHRRVTLLSLIDEPLDVSAAFHDLDDAREGERLAANDFLNAYYGARAALAHQGDIVSSS